MYTQYLMHGNGYRSRNLSSVYCTLINSLGKREVCAVWIAHMHNDDQWATHVLATTHLQLWRY